MGLTERAGEVDVLKFFVRVLQQDLERWIDDAFVVRDACNPITVRHVEKIDVGVGGMFAVARDTRGDFGGAQKGSSKGRFQYHHPGHPPDPRGRRIRLAPIY